MEAHETHEKIHETAHHGHEEGHEGGNKSNLRTAVFISILACLLSIVEICGNTAASSSAAANIEASNLWAFFQAKTIRATTMRLAADALETVTADGQSAKDKNTAIEKRIAEWRTTAEHYDSEPSSGEGRKELAERAKQAEEKRDRETAATHLFELAAAGFQIAIVISSAAIVTKRRSLLFLASGLALFGVIIALIAWLDPGLLHHH